ncbi:MAG: hypothetical protein FWH52_04920 [Synergistaceae bacterium]|nr:hypothetical protein [Synergistaceae bacterium]
MYQAYAGRVCNGQPFISEGVILPENANLIITVLNESPFVDVSDKNQKELFSDRKAHRAAFEEFFAAMAEIEDEPLDDEFDAILAKRVNIKRELNL